MLFSFIRGLKFPSNLLSHPLLLTQAALLGLIILPPAVNATGSNTSDKSPMFSAAQQEEIGQIAAMYLAQHPEYLTAAQETLRQNQIVAQNQKIASAVSGNTSALLAKNGPEKGPANSHVAVIIFSDYQAHDSLKLESVIDSFSQQHPNVRFIYKEFPITAGRWTASGTAAIVAQQTWNDKGAEAYFSIRKKLFAIHHGEGQLSEADIAHVMKETHIPELKPGIESQALRADINSNLKLGQNMGMTTSPVVIVLPQTVVSDNKVSVFNHVPSNEQLNKAIEMAGVNG